MTTELGALEEAGLTGDVVNELTMEGDAMANEGVAKEEAANESSVGKLVVAFGVGALFAVGLAMSGMTMPSKVVGFLDFFGAWDPSLMFVMVGGIGVYMAAFQWINKRAGRGDAPVFAPRYMIPTRRDINPRLVVGAALFGVGWGLGGFCPGPALASLGTGSLSVLVFVASMATGMAVWKQVETILANRDD